MPYVVVRGHVEDYARWEQGFRQNAARRQAAGLQTEQVLRDAQDPCEIVIVFEVDDVARARQYLESDVSRGARQQQGVTREGLYFPGA